MVCRIQAWSGEVFRPVYIVGRPGETGKESTKTMQRWVNSIKTAWQAWEEELHLGECLRRIMEFFQLRAGAGQEPDLGQDLGYGDS